MQLRRYVQNISNMLSILFLFIADASFASGDLFVVEYSSSNTVTVSKGSGYDAEAASNTAYFGSSYSYCNKSSGVVTVGVGEAGFGPGSLTSAMLTTVASASGKTGKGCLESAGALFPVTATYSNSVYTLNGICINGGTSKSPYKEGSCYPFSKYADVTVKDAECTISSGDITHDYGTISADEVEGKSLTATATIACSGGYSGGEVNVELSLSNEKISLKDDGSLYATIDLGGKGNSTNVTIGIDSAINLNVTSTISSNGDVSGGSFSGSSVLTMTYY